MCFGEEVPAATEKAATYKTVIKVMMALQALICLLNFIAVSQFLLQAVFGIFLIPILYAIQHQCSYQIIMMYIFISIYFAISFMIFFLTPIQNQINPKSYSNMDQYIYADSIISFIFYCFAMVFCFYPYREFKAIAFNQNPALRNYFEGAQPNDDNNPRKDDPNERRVDYQPNYGNLEYDKNRRNNDHGTFEVFKGQGVKIG